MGIAQTLLKLAPRGSASARSEEEQVSQNVSGTEAEAQSIQAPETTGSVETSQPELDTTPNVNDPVGTGEPELDTPNGSDPVGTGEPELDTTPNVNDPVGTGEPELDTSPNGSDPVETSEPELDTTPGGSDPAGSPDVAELIKKVGELHDAGVLNDDEFSAKKADLLARL